MFVGGCVEHQLHMYVYRVYDSARMIWHNAAAVLLLTTIYLLVLVWCCSTAAAAVVETAVDYDLEQEH